MFPQGRFWYWFRAYRMVGDSYHHVPFRDVAAAGRCVEEAMGRADDEHFQPSCTVINPVCGVMYPGDGHAYVSESWLPRPLLGVSLN